MLLPQSSAFATLRNRLSAVSSLGFLQTVPRCAVSPPLLIPLEPPRADILTRRTPTLQRIPHPAPPPLLDPPLRPGRLAPLVRPEPRQLLDQPGPLGPVPHARRGRHAGPAVDPVERAPRALPGGAEAPAGGGVPRETGRTCWRGARGRGAGGGGNRVPAGCGRRRWALWWLGCGCRRRRRGRRRRGRRRRLAPRRDGRGRPAALWRRGGRLLCARGRRRSERWVVECAERAGRAQRGRGRGTGRTGGPPTRAQSAARRDGGGGWQEAWAGWVCWSRSRSRVQEELAKR